MTIILRENSIYSCYLVVHSIDRSTVQYSTVQYSTVQYSTVQYSTVQYSTVQCIAVCVCVCVAKVCRMMYTVGLVGGGI